MSVYKEKSFYQRKIGSRNMDGYYPARWKHFFTVFTLYSAPYQAVFVLFKTPYLPPPLSDKYNNPTSIANVNKRPTKNPKVRPIKYHPIPNRMIKR